jgi:hypothetical protein
MCKNEIKDIYYLDNFEIENRFPRANTIKYLDELKIYLFILL